jgi:hypothetical protein
MSPDGGAELRRWLSVLARVHAETLQRPEATQQKLDSTLSYLQGERE